MGLGDRHSNERKDEDRSCDGTPFHRKPYIDPHPVTFTTTTTVVVMDMNENEMMAHQHHHDQATTTPMNRTATTRPPPTLPFKKRIISSLDSTIPTHVPNLSGLPWVTTFPFFGGDVVWNTPPRVITPQPIRPVDSTIILGQYRSLPKDHASPVPKLAEELEAELESDILPAVITDSKCLVRVANSKYMEMVGQPECPWLKSFVGTELSLSTSSSVVVGRINGKVKLDLSQSSPFEEPELANDECCSNERFLCMVRIEWPAGVGPRLTTVTCPCDINAVSCVSKDYAFIWRFKSMNGVFDEME